MQKRNRWTLVVTMLLFSCKTSTIIPEKDMISILVKISITDATVVNSDLRKTYFDKDTIDYYGKTIQSFGYSSAQFDSSLKHYSKAPKELDAIYDKVIIELSKIQTDLATLSKKDSTGIDSLKNLWSLKTEYNLSLDGPQDLIFFDIPVVGLGTYTLSYDIQIFADDESVNPQLKIYFYYNNKTESGDVSHYITKPYIKDGVKRTITTQMELRNSLVTKLKGLLLDYSNPNKNFRSHATVSNIKVNYKPFSPKNKKSFKRSKRAESAIQ